MKKQLLICLILATFGAFSVSAQERYLDEIFDEVDVVEGIVYGENWDYYGNFVELEADIYTPVGDSETQRPMVIMMHAGSFLPQSILPFGTNEDPHLVEMCEQFAKRGWTAASISYRLGWNPFGDEDVRAGTIITAVYRAMQDLKTAARFFRRSVDVDGNPYGIDPTRIVGAGTNSGGYCVLAALHLDRGEELLLDKFLDSSFNPFVDTLMVGNIEGQFGDPMASNYQWDGYSSEINMGLNLGGAIGDISWMEAGENPIVSFHGVLEELTPYDTDIVVVSLTGEQVVEVSGSRDVGIRANELGINDGYLTLDDPYSQAARANFEAEGAEGEGTFLFPQYGFEPWGYYKFCDGSNVLEDDDPETEFCSSTLQVRINEAGDIEQYITNEIVAAPFIDTIMNYFAPRAMVTLELDGFEELIGDPDSREDVLAEAGLSVHPNPSVGLFSFGSETIAIETIEILDLAGRVVRSIEAKNAFNVSVDLTGETPGIYLAELRLANGSKVAKKLLLNN